MQDTTSPESSPQQVDVPPVTGTSTEHDPLPGGLVAESDRSRNRLPDSSDDLAHQWEDFRQERESWEMERQQEVDRLRREGRLLTDAWQRLEAEGRNLLAEREFLRSRTTRQAPGPRQAADRPDSIRTLAALQQSRSGGGQNAEDHSAWQHFQQLRREMQRHAQRTAQGSKL